MRQARRFVYFLLHADPNFVKALVAEINSLREVVGQCTNCFRYFEGDGAQCIVCRDGTRDHHTLVVVEKDTDLELIQKSSVFGGQYFVLGGLLPLVEKKTTAVIRERELKERIESEAKQHELREVVLALSANPQGDNTRYHLMQALEPLVKKHSITVTALGRGLSTGTEVEYSDAETIKNAFHNRH